MKKIITILFLVTSITSGALAGGVMTNLNQSASYIRMMTRDASIGMDATFYNPAGLYKLENGFHVSLSNQSIFQSRTIVSTYPTLDPTPKTYEGSVNAPLYPNVYAIYKMDKWAFSFGLTPIGGGGSATFEKGVPSFEYPVSSLVPSLNAALLPLDEQLALVGLAPGYSNITGYGMDMNFEGSSIYLGYQVNATYEINEKLGLSLGARYVSASNSYKGSLTDVSITSASTAQPGTFTPGNYMRAIAGDMTSLAGTLPPGHPAIPTLLGTAVALTAQGAGLDALTGDVNLDVTQKGSGITPIIGLHFSPNDMFDFSVKYEHHTKIELENEGDDGGTGMFPTGEKARGDLPTFISLGAAVKPIPRLTIMAGFHWFNDKGAYYGRTDDAGDQVSNEDYFDSNGMEIALGVEYGLSEKFYISAGYLYSGGGANDDYQTDISYSQAANSIGAGILYKVNEKIGINLAGGYAAYIDYEKSSTDPNFGAYKETYDKTTTFIAVGVDFSF